MTLITGTNQTHTTFSGTLDPDSGKVSIQGQHIAITNFELEGNLSPADREKLLAGLADPDAVDLQDGTDRVAAKADGQDEVVAAPPAHEVPEAYTTSGRYTEAASADAIGLGMKGEPVRAKQQELADAGYDLGEHGVDGFWGPDTQTAWEQYQGNDGKPLDEAAAAAAEATDGTDRTQQHDAMRAKYDELGDVANATGAPDYSYDAATRTLSVEGTDDGDRLRLSYDGDRSAYDVRYTNGDGEETLLTSVDEAGLDRIMMSGRGGDDTIYVDESVNEAKRRIEIGAGGNAGTDAILNAGDGATLVDGDGNDVYLNSGDGVTVGQYRPRAGEAPVTGSDAVFNVADGVHVSLGNDGDHMVVSQGDKNRIVLGDGDNRVRSEGDRNRIFVGHGDNLVGSRGEGSGVITGRGRNVVVEE